MPNERIRVLYVDDEQGNLRAFTASFRRDLDVTTAESAEEAMLLMEKDPFPVVLSDQRMPGTTGSALLARIRARWPRTVRFLLTGYSDLEAVVDAVNEGGIHAYVSKPWDPVDLKLRIEQAYEVHSLRAEKEELYERYRQLFDRAGDPILILDRRGHFVEVNQAALDLIGMDHPTLLECPLERLVPDMAQLSTRMRRSRRSDTFHNLDLTITTARGDTIDCLMTLTYMGGRSSEGRYQAVLKDITDRKLEEKRLKKLNGALDKRVNVRTKQLKEALDDLSAFSYSVAHDLRSPLKNIRAMIDHVADMDSEHRSAEELDLLQRIGKSASRLTSLVDDLLRFASTDMQPLEHDEADLRSVMEDCLNELAKEHPQVAFAVPEQDDARIMADGAMLGVALSNLLNNAVKFSRNNPAPRVEVGHTRRPEGDLIWVRDNGVGFDPDKSELVFGVFKRLHRPDQFEGTGIGLAIVQRIMQKHSGRCWAESEPGKGATFYLEFPRRVEEPRLQASDRSAE